MSKSQKLYEQYVTDGPSSLSLDQTRQALDFEDSEPKAALEVRLRVEADKRESEARELMRDTWVRQGGDASQFQAAYKELSAEKKKEAMAAAESEARAASLRRMARGF